MNKRIFLLLGLLGVFWLIIAGWLLWGDMGVPILAYHSVRDTDDEYCISSADFANHMNYLEENSYTAISLAELLEGLAGKRQLPSKPVVITFDDGYADNYLTALPILQKYHMKGTVFVISGNVGQENYLTWDQIKEMQRNGMEIGSHTVSHLPLNELDYASKVRELKDSKQVLEAKLGKKVSFLAYPFGQYDRDMPDILKNTGYLGACSGKPGTNYAGTNPYALYRVNIPNPKFGMWEFKLRLWRAIVYGKIKNDVLRRFR